MKVLSLTEPWATLVAIGAKRIETRSWSTRYRGPLLIHATAGTPYLPWNHADEGAQAMTAALARAGIANRNGLAVGALVARCVLLDVLPAAAVTWNPLELPTLGRIYGASVFVVGRRDERHFGDFTRGRYAWILGEVRRIEPPLPARGRQGLWEFPRGDPAGDPVAPCAPA